MKLWCAWVAVVALCMTLASGGTQVKLTNGTYGYLLFLNEATQQWHIVHASVWTSYSSRLACMAANLSSTYAFATQGPSFPGMPNDAEYPLVFYQRWCNSTSPDLFGCPFYSFWNDPTSSSLVFVDCPNECAQSSALDPYTCRVCKDRVMEPSSNCTAVRSEYATKTDCRNPKLYNLSSCSSCELLPAMQPASDCKASKYQCRLRDYDGTVGRRGFAECRPGKHHRWSAVVAAYSATGSFLTNNTFATLACLAAVGNSTRVRATLEEVSVSSYFRFTSCPSTMRSVWDCNFEANQVTQGGFGVQALFLECQSDCANDKLDPIEGCGLCIDRSCDPATNCTSKHPLASPDGACIDSRYDPATSCTTCLSPAMDPTHGCQTTTWEVRLSAGQYGFVLLRRSPSEEFKLTRSAGVLSAHAVSLLCSAAGYPTTQGNAGVRFNGAFGAPSILFYPNCTANESNIFECPTATNVLDKDCSFYVECDRPCPSTKFEPLTNCSVCVDKTKSAASNCTQPLALLDLTTGLSTCHEPYVSPSSGCTECTNNAMDRRTNCTTPRFTVLLSDDNYGIPLIQRTGYGPLAISDDGFDNYTAALFCRAFDPQATVVSWQRSGMVGVDHLSEYLIGASTSCTSASPSLWSCLSITIFAYVPVSHDLYVSCMRPCAASALDPQTNCTLCMDRSMNASSLCSQPLGTFIRLGVAPLSSNLPLCHPADLSTIRAAFSPEKPLPLLVPGMNVDWLYSSSGGYLYCDSGAECYDLILTSENYVRTRQNAVCPPEDIREYLGTYYPYQSAVWYQVQCNGDAPPQTHLPCDVCTDPQADPRNGCQRASCGINVPVGSFAPSLAVQAVAVSPNLAAHVVVSGKALWSAVDVEQVASDGSAWSWSLTMDNFYLFRSCQLFPHSWMRASDSAAGEITADVPLNLKLCGRTSNDTWVTYTCVISIHSFAYIHGVLSDNVMQIAQLLQVPKVVVGNWTGNVQDLVCNITSDRVLQCKLLNPTALLSVYVLDSTDWIAPLSNCVVKQGGFDCPLQAMASNGAHNALFGVHTTTGSTMNLYVAGIFRPPYPFTQQVTLLNGSVVGLFVIGAQGNVLTFIRNQLLVFGYRTISGLACVLDRVTLRNVKAEEFVLPSSNRTAVGEAVLVTVAPWIVLDHFEFNSSGVLTLVAYFDYAEARRRDENGKVSVVSLHVCDPTTPRPVPGNSVYLTVVIVAAASAGALLVVVGAAVVIRLRLRKKHHHDDHNVEESEK